MAASSTTSTTDTDAEPDVAPPRQTGAFSRNLLIVTLLALVGRIGYVLFVKRDNKDVFAEGDAFFYSSVAHNLGKGNFYVNPFNGTPAADHPPLTVLVLGPASAIFRDSILAQRLTMALIGAATVFVIGLIGRQVAGPRAGLLAAVAAAIYPNLWVNDGLVMSESISALTTAGLVLAGCRLAESPTMRRALVAGALCGLAVLARAEVGLLLPLMIWPVVALARSVPWKARLARMAAATAMTVAVIAPWSIYNLTQFPETVLISTNDGTVVRGAYCDATMPDGGLRGGWSQECVFASSEEGVDPSVNAARQRREGIEYAKGHLSELPELTYYRLGRTFGWHRPDNGVLMGAGEGRDWAISWWCWWTFWFAVPCAAYGAFVLWRRRVSLWPFAATVVTTVAVSAALYGLPRFRLPMEVTVAVLVGVAADAVLRRLRGGDEPEPPTGESGDDPRAEPATDTAPNTETDAPADSSSLPR
jgi:4-amino-4-deoxy-L-arabinose transferase-like glycosyltransferase